MRGDRYAKLPIAAITDPRLNATDVRVLAFLGAHANDANTCHPGQKRIAEALGIGRRTVIRSIAALEAAGYVRSVRRTRDGKRTSNGYRIVFENAQGDLDLHDANNVQTGAKKAAKRMTLCATSGTQGGEPKCHLRPELSATSGTTGTSPENYTTAATARERATDANSFIEIGGYRDALFAALGPKADEWRGGGRLEALAVPLEWVRQGADPQDDILPTVRRLAERARRITNWSYFTGAVMEAKAEREGASPSVALAAQRADAAQAERASRPGASPGGMRAGATPAARSKAPHRPGDMLAAFDRLFGEPEGSPATIDHQPERIAR